MRDFFTAFRVNSLQTSIHEVPFCELQYVGLGFSKFRGVVVRTSVNPVMDFEFQPLFFEVEDEPNFYRTVFLGVP